MAYFKVLVGLPVQNCSGYGFPPTRLALTSFSSFFGVKDGPAHLIINQVNCVSFK